MTATLNSTGVAYGDATQQNTAWIGGRGQVFTASNTFTVPTGITAIKVSLCGGGGNGGTGSSFGNAAGGGGGGGVAIKYITGLTPGSTVSVTVGGVGGTSSFGAYCSATGGSTPATNSTTGGAGGSATGGDMNFSGGSGGNGFALTIACVFYGGGGSGGGAGAGVKVPQSIPATNGVFPSSSQTGMLGGSGAIGATSSVNAAGNAATGYGNGGSGCVAATSASGGAGTGGVVIVEW